MGQRCSIAVLDHGLELSGLFVSSALSPNSSLGGGAIGRGDRMSPREISIQWDSCSKQSARPTDVGNT